jgi:hypothetical protein
VNTNQIRPILHTVRQNDSMWLLAQRYDTTINAIASSNPGVDLNPLRIGQKLYIFPGNKFYQQYCSLSPLAISKKGADLRNYLRMLWEQHVTWTRLAILSIVFGLSDINLVTNRLLRNPIDFKEALKPLYGERNASKFTELFTSHLVIAAQLVNAAKIGDNTATANAEKRWYENADEIAFFLAGINPYWSQNDWEEMLHEHLAMTKAEAVDMLAGNYAAGIDEFDAIEKQALKMADVMADGIASQFPNKF